MISTSDNILAVCLTSIKPGVSLITAVCSQPVQNKDMFNKHWLLGPFMFESASTTHLISSSDRGTVKMTVYCVCSVYRYG